jgi:hypothetical protein
MCILPSTPAFDSPTAPTPVARRLPPQQRQQLALQALTGQNISALAHDHDVSRKFVYQQASKAEQALDQAFAPPEPNADTRVLFHLPVTKAWLHQLALGLVLVCHSSYRGVVELCRDLFDYPLAVGTVHNIVQRAVARARRHNDGVDLSAVRLGAADEIFQSGQAVLVGADVASTFCYLLSLEDQLDGDTWAIRLWELQERGFRPEATLADFGSALRAGHALALPTTPCRGDVFHALQDLPPVLATLEKRAYQAMEARDKLERQQARYQWRHGRSDPKLTGKLLGARQGETRAVALADDVAVLSRWLREDIVAVAGPAAAERRLLYDFVVGELRARAAVGPQALALACRLLEPKPEEILAFAVPLDQDLSRVAQDFQVPVSLVREALYVQSLSATSPRRWQREAVLRQHLRGRFPALHEAVADVARRTVRASSVIENLNSRLRNYFFLRRHLGPDYLALLQFFLNHRRFLRSEHAERVDHSPAELLTGKPHPHWLELLGYERFARP